MLTPLTIILIAVGLAMDAFAVAMATSIQLRTISGRQIFRLAFHFGLFQFLMPLIGWAGGRELTQFIGGWDHWIAFGLLVFVGLKAIHAALAGEEHHARRGDPTRGLSLIMLSIATSIDALAVGLSFAMLQVVIWYPVVVIGCITGALTIVGMRLGSRLGAHFGQRVEILGGLVLIGIGIKIVLQHTGVA